MPERKYDFKKFGVTAALLLGISGTVCAKNLALLVGVGVFKHIVGLEGPENDARSLRDVLVEKWQYAPDDVVVLTNEKATKEAVLRELLRLKERSAPGDRVLVYFSTHGTSTLDTKARSSSRIPYCSGALALYDTNPQNYADTLLQGKRDLKPALKALDDGDRQVWVVADSCYSGQLVRGSDTLPNRFLSIVEKDSPIEQDLSSVQMSGTGSCEEFTYKNTVFLSAASEGEVAGDINKKMLATGRWNTLDGKPHGVMTDALLRVLAGQTPSDYDGDGVANLNELHRSISDTLLTRGYAQTPQKLPSLIDDVAGISYRSLLGSAKPVVPSAIENQKSLLISMSPTIDSGLAAAIRSAKEFKLVSEPNQYDIQLTSNSKQLELWSRTGDKLGSTASMDNKAAMSRLRQYAWGKKLRLIAIENQQGFLALDFNPSRFGGNYLIGEKLNLTLKSQKPAHILLINIDSNGLLSVLYPFTSKELVLQPKQQLLNIPAPNDFIVVKEPVGTDMLFAFAFERKNPKLEKLVGLTDIETADPRLLLLQQLLEEEKGKFTFYHSELRVMQRTKK